MISINLQTSFTNLASHCCNIWRNIISKCWS